MRSCCGLSLWSWGALGGLLSAIFGAICGWLLFPALIAINVEKVNTKIMEKFKKIFQQKF